MKTFMMKKEEVDRGWYVIDAKDQYLGRIATRIATILRGKNKATYTPHIDNGDFVIVINADKIKLSGNKELQKKYYRHTGYPGGIREIDYKDMIAKFPERVVRQAVKGMIPHNKLGRQILTKLKVYKGDAHPHTAQLPKTINF